MKSKPRLYYTVEVKHTVTGRRKVGLIMEIVYLEDWIAVSNSLFTLPRAKQLLKNLREYNDAAADNYRIVRLKREVINVKH